MGFSIKTVGGIAVTGLAGFYLVNKLINMAGNAISEINEASKWRCYYRHAGQGDTVPPGYASMEKENCEIVSPEELNRRERQKKAEREGKGNDLAKVISEAIDKCLKAYMDAKGIKTKDKPVVNYNGYGYYRHPEYGTTENGDTDGDETEEEQEEETDDIPVTYAENEESKETDE